MPVRHQNARIHDEISRFGREKKTTVGKLKFEIISQEKVASFQRLAKIIYVIINFNNPLSS